MGLFFEKLFSVNVRHDFFENGISEDIKILPTIEGSQLIKGGKMVYKQTASGFKVIYKAVDNNTSGGTPLVDLNADVTFTFTLHLSNNAEFLNITDLDVGAENYSKNKIVYFKNNGTAKSLVYSFIDSLKPKLFTYVFPIIAANPGDRGILKVTDKNGALVTIPGKNGLPDTEFPIEDIVPDETGVYKQPIDFRFLPKGLYTFEYKDTLNTTPQTELIYIDNELAGQNIFGLLDIEYLSGDLYGTGEDYDLEFVRKETQWKYLVVVKTPDDVISIDLTKLTIKDRSTDPNPSDNPYAHYNFTNIGNTTINGFKTAILTSNRTDIPFFEIAKLRLELEHKSNKLIKNLPNPPRDGPSGQQAEIYVYI